MSPVALTLTLTLILRCRALPCHLIMLWESGLLRPSHVDRCLRLAAGEQLDPQPVMFPAPASGAKPGLLPMCDATLSPEVAREHQVRGRCLPTLHACSSAHVKGKSCSIVPVSAVSASPADLTRAARTSCMHQGHWTRLGNCCCLRWPCNVTYSHCSAPLGLPGHET